MPKSAISHPDIFEPPGGGMYSAAFLVTGGKTLYIAGQVGRDKGGKVVGPGDIRAQTRQAMENLGLLLAAGGATFADVVQSNIYVLDVSHKEVIREVRREFLVRPYPTSVFVQVGALAYPEFLVEIDAVAVVG